MHSKSNTNPITNYRAIPLRQADFEKGEEKGSLPIHIHIYCPFVVPEPVVMATEADDYVVNEEEEDFMATNGSHTDLNLINLNDDEDKDPTNGLYSET